MKLKGLIPIDKKKAPKRGKYVEEAFLILSEFQKSKEESVKVNATYESKKEFNGIYNTLLYIREREKLPIDVRQSKGDIYLIKQ